MKPKLSRLPEPCSEMHWRENHALAFPGVRVVTRFCDVMLLAKKPSASQRFNLRSHIIASRVHLRFSPDPFSLSHQRPVDDLPSNLARKEAAGIGGAPSAV